MSENKCVETNVCMS